MRTATDDRGDERLAAVLAMLDRGVEAMLTSDGFAAYLRMMARFPTYSARNVALIYAQRPDATRVLGDRCGAGSAASASSPPTGAPSRRVMGRKQPTSVQP
jgi:hypothetical protein